MTWNGYIYIKICLTFYPILFSIKTELLHAMMPDTTKDTPCYALASSCQVLATKHSRPKYKDAYSFTYTHTHTHTHTYADAHNLYTYIKRCKQAFLCLYVP